MKKVFLIFIAFIFFVAAMPVEKNSVEESGELKENPLESFQSIIDVPDQGVKVPTVFEVPMSFDKKFLNSVAVVDESDDSFLPNLVISNNLVKTVTWNVLDSSVGGKAESLMDKDNNTYKEYSVSDDDSINKVSIKIKATNQLVETSSLTFNFDRYVALPKTIQISVYDEESENYKIILAKSLMRSSTINFPKVSGRDFKIELEYSQPLRIREISLNPANLQQSSSTVRFLAQSGKSYKIYYNTDRYVKVETDEMPNLRDDKDILVVNNFSESKNSIYKKSDVDYDGIPDELDNCVFVANKNQEDVNENGRGDVCDDFDRDGVINSKDNCPNDPNRYQEDEDVDGIGDICDMEESRFFARNSWLPMTLIVMVGVIVVSLFLITFRKKAD